MKKTKILSAFVILLMVTACSGNAPAVEATPIDVGALQTAAVQTVMADFTRTVEAQPTLAPTETFTPEPAAATATQAPTETPAPELSPTVALCDNSTYVSDASVPDNTQMTAGQVFVKTWKVKNSGSCAWNTGYQIIHAYGEKMGGLPTSLAAEVAPGSEAEISINLKAPTKPGTYGGYFRLTNNNGVPFGMVLSVIIIVP